MANVGQAGKRSRKPAIPTTILRGSSRPVRQSTIAPGPAAPEGSGARPGFVLLFLLSLFIPWIFTLGTIALSPYRLVLLVTTLPCLVMWLTGKAGPIRTPDIALLLYWAWSTLSYFVLHGVSQAIESSGILFFETLGPYLLARCYVRSASDFHRMISLLFMAIAALLPFAILETLTGRDVLKNLFALVMRTHADAGSVERWGLNRVQSVFEHPILFGVVTGSVLSLVHMVLGYGQSFAQRAWKTFVIALTSFLSLSAGPISAIVMQLGLLVWNRIARRYETRWKILWAIFIAIYALVAMVSNQTVPEFYLTHFAFDQQSANYRVLIWVFGKASVMNHPWFGVGLGQWDRPDWMPPSIDMFWLIHAVQHGLPAGLFMALAFFSAYIPISFKKGLDEKLDQYRTGYSIMMTGFFLVGWTVDFWNATYVLFLFLLGSGIWLLDQGRPDHRGRREPNAPDASHFQGI